MRSRYVGYRRGEPHVFRWLAGACLLFHLLVSNAQEEAADRQPVGTAICSTCHNVTVSHWSHTTHAKLFPQAASATGVDAGCESCHGPGSEHILNPAKPDSIVRFTRSSTQTVEQQNAMCMTCHQGGGRMHWASSIHERNDLACGDCHNPMANVSANNLLARNDVNETCFLCHKEQRAQFQRRSHMPLLEGKMTCIDCHNPHGSNTHAMLKTPTVNENCYQCHAEKRGPFIFEHAPVREDCLTCHAPHGSNHEDLLVTARPVLCQQCHSAIGHVNTLMTRGNLASGNRPDSRVIGRSCLNCHTQVHGSNHPAGMRLQR